MKMIKDKSEILTLSYLGPTPRCCVCCMVVIAECHMKGQGQQWRTVIIEDASETIRQDPWSGAGD